MDFFLNFGNQSAIKSIYYAIFESNFNYASIVWAQKITSSHRLFLLQKKAIRIIKSHKSIILKF